MKQVNNYKHKALCIETNDFIVNVGRTNSEHKLLPSSAYKREYAKANAGLSTQLSFDFLNDTSIIQKRLHTSMRCIVEIGII